MDVPVQLRCRRRPEQRIHRDDPDQNAKHSREKKEIPLSHYIEHTVDCHTSGQKKTTPPQGIEQGKERGLASAVEGILCGYILIVFRAY